MTNYDTLKKYEAHKEPLPSYDEYKRLQEQLKEANGIIKGASHLSVKDKRNAIICELISPEINDYLKKWGVK